MSLGLYSLTIMDYSREKSNHRVNTGEVTAISLPGLLSEVAAYLTGVEGITLGAMNRQGLSVFDQPLSASPPTDKGAQREEKWLVVYHDNTPFFDPGIDAIPNAGYNKSFKLEVPTADPSLVINHTDFADITAGAMATYVAAFQAMARSPYGGVTVVDYVKYVGRNL